MNLVSFKNAFSRLSSTMKESRDLLVEMDSQNGDGDLGISMSEGFSAIDNFAASFEDDDLGRFLMRGASVFNEAAPSSLGTIISFGLMGMAKSLKGKSECDVKELAEAMQAGAEHIMVKAESKRGEKTILDSLCPGIDELLKSASQGINEKEAFCAAASAAAEGAESTKSMEAVHGRAARYKNKSLGLMDGGAMVGKLIFQAISG